VIAGNQVTAVQSWRSRLQRWTDSEKLNQHEDKVLLVLTLIIGAVVGLVIAGFIYLTETLGSRMYPAGGAAWRRMVIPTAGSLITGYLLSRYFPNARGSGIPQTKGALFLRDGFISFRTVVGKFFLSSTSLASGIALGREGPSVQIGAGLASVLGRRLGLGPANIRQLVPIGAAAALAAAFNTPVAAVLFTLEEVLGDLHAPVLGSIVLSSATSWIVLHLLLGDEPLFHVPAYQLVSPVEFISYAVLGVVGGVVSVCFVKLLLFIRKSFKALPRWSDWLQPAAGGLLVGVMGWFVPEVLGVGYGHVSEALNGQMALTLMALLVVLKLIATAACYGTGNAGGIFGPSLFIGAMLGGAVGSAAHQLFPDYTGSVGAYALVGMGAAFAGIVRVPLASVIMIFEMTRDYSIIVPLMISNLMSFYISYKLQKEPIYEALQHQDGLHLPSRLKDRQGMLMVRHAMTPVTHRLSKFDPLRDALAFFDDDRDACPVLDGSMLLGMVSRAAIEAAMTRGGADQTLAELFPNHDPPESLRAESFPHVHFDHPLDVALRRMAQSKLNVLPVVSRSNVRELRGLVSLQDILRAYGVVNQPAPGQQPVGEEARTSPKFVSGMIAALLVLVFLIGFLHYSYRSRRGERADRCCRLAHRLRRGKHRYSRQCLRWIARPRGKKISAAPRALSVTRCMAPPARAARGAGTAGLARGSRDRRCVSPLRPGPAHPGARDRDFGRERRPAHAGNGGALGMARPRAGAERPARRLSRHLSEWSDRARLAEQAQRSRCRCLERLLRGAERHGRAIRRPRTLHGKALREAARGEPLPCRWFQRRRYRAGL